MELQTKNGFTFLIDEENQQILAGKNWSYLSSGSKKYVRCGNIYLHRILAGAKAGEFVDHKDGNTLNNTKENLRICSKVENNRNKKSGRPSKYGFRGITFHRIKNRFRAVVYDSISGKRIQSSYFKTPKEAALKYDEMAKIYYKEFAILNFPDEAAPAPPPQTAGLPQIFGQEVKRLEVEFK